MLKEIIHYLTLSARTKSRLSYCINLISEKETIVSNNFDNNLKNKKLGLVVKNLIERGEKLNILDTLFWSNLHSVTIDHKMRDQELRISEKVNKI